ncbi:MAG: DUF3127 domain-containing protein [Prolixibacteraceae bacterium]|nr:DUF3127 domain-containing protein [Prolixibacteraceae bacterium]
MALNIKGKIEKILDAESGVSRAGNQWNKQEFVIETMEQFPKKVCFTLFGDKTSMIENMSVGEEVEVSFNLESREFNGKWFHNINAWKIDKTSEAPVADLPPEYSVDDIPPELADDVTNDLPF